MKLRTERNLTEPDALYARLIDAHRGLNDAESSALNARLILILMNHIGDPEAVTQAIELAERSAQGNRA